MALTVEIQGLAPLLAALQAYPDIVRPELGRASEAALLSLIPDLADYPPPPAGSQYRRTGDLGRMWTTAQPEFAPISSGFEASIGNATPYAPEVQGEFQAKVHRGRWWAAEQVLVRNQHKVEAYFEQALENVARKIDEATT